MTGAHVAEPTDWVEIDGYGKLTGAAFTGGFGELRAHLLAGCPDGAVSGPRPAPVYLRGLYERLTCPLVTLRTPWGTTRWIPRPPPSGRPARPYAWILRR